MFSLTATTFVIQGWVAMIDAERGVLLDGAYGGITKGGGD
jgi:hypothetical protein